MQTLAAREPRATIARTQREYRQRPERKLADRKSYLKRKYGMTLEDYERMLEAQGGVCAICGEPRPEERTLHVDHDHETGEIRGLLCFRCNNALGDFARSTSCSSGRRDYLDRDDELAALARERVKALSALRAGGRLPRRCPSPVSLPLFAAVHRPRAVVRRPAPPGRTAPAPGAGIEHPLDARGPARHDRRRDPLRATAWSWPATAGPPRATLIASRRIEKVFPADDYSGVAIAGAAGPAVEMVKLFQVQLEHYEKVQGDLLSLEGKANQLGQLVRANLPAAMQGFVVVPLFAGYDDQRRPRPGLLLRRHRRPLRRARLPVAGLGQRPRPQLDQGRAGAKA